MKLCYFLFPLAFVFFQNCHSPSQSDADLALLKSWMTGSFSSQEQAEKDTNYFDIRLEMVEIWKERPDGFWLYVEQASAQSLDQPYRQRVYHVTDNKDGSFTSTAFTINNPLRFAGAYKKADPLAQLHPDSLSKREGCAVTLKKYSNDMVSGNTDGKNCVSTLRGASYATSEVTIKENSFISWDRGWNENDEQVWGARNGGYIFKKVKNYQRD